MSPTFFDRLRGEPGYNATGAAEDDAALAAFAGETSGPTLLGAMLRDRFVVQLPKPSGSATTDTARVTAAINALPTGPLTYGGTLQFQEGQYQFNTPLPLKTGVGFRGRGKFSTDLRVVEGNLFEPTSSIGNLLFEGLTLTSIAGHIFDLGATGGIHQSGFLNMAMVVWTAASSMMVQNGSGDTLEVMFSNCEFNRKATATVPAFDLKGPAGGINDNTWENCRAHSNGATSTPFWRLEGTRGSYVHDNRWVNIVGEQNRGGLVHLYSAYGGGFDDVYDWDAGAPYVDHIVLLGKSGSGGVEPKRVRVRNVGTRYETMTAGKFHLYIPPTLSPEGIVIENVGDPNGTSLVSVPSTGRVFLGPSGATPSSRAVTADYSVDPAVDGVIVCDAAGPITVSLPAATSVPAGYSVRVMNKAGSAVSVHGTSSDLVNGAAFQLLFQWSSRAFTSTGTEWIG
jgi:hypothetical protein